MLPGLEDVEGGGCVLGERLDEVRDPVFDERDFEHIVVENVDDAERVGLASRVAGGGFFAESYVEV